MVSFFCSVAKGVADSCSISDPLLSSLPASNPTVNQMDPIGVAPPGESTIKFVTMEEGKEWPFRITGLAISPSDETVNAQ
jgi:hypothetical protein